MLERVLKLKSKTPKPKSITKKDNKIDASGVNELLDSNYLSYVFDYGLKQKPVSDAFLHDLAAKVVLKIHEDESILIMSEIYVALRVPEPSIENWRKRSKALELAIQHAKIIVGIRREKGMYRGLFPAAPIMRTMHLFKKEWQKSDKYHASLKADLLEKLETGIQVVYVPTIETPRPEHLSRQVKKKVENV